jgi:hypothetical protein
MNGVPHRYRCRMRMISPSGNAAEHQRWNRKAVLETPEMGSNNAPLGAVYSIGPSSGRCCCSMGCSIAIRGWCIERRRAWQRPGRGRVAVLGSWCVLLIRVSAVYRLKRKDAACNSQGSCTCIHGIKNYPWLSSTALHPPCAVDNSLRSYGRASSIGRRACPGRNPHCCYAQRYPATKPAPGTRQRQPTPPERAYTYLLPLFHCGLIAEMQTVRWRQQVRIHALEREIPDVQVGHVERGLLGSRSDTGLPFGVVGFHEVPSV